MRVQIRLLSAIFTTIPAILWGALIYLSANGDYFWKMYYIAAVAFLVFSFLIGFFLLDLSPGHWTRHPWLWLFGQGSVAWIIATLILGLLTITPLCVGQDNGDGINDLGLCIAQTILVLFIYSPLELLLLCLSAVPGGWFLKQLAGHA